MKHFLNYRSAFFWYSQDERPKVRGANPEFNVGDVAKELGRRWADAGPELKSKYEALAEKDRARYGNAKREYQISLKNGNSRVVTKNGESQGGEESPNKIPNSYPSQKTQNMQETMLEETALLGQQDSENNPDENNSSFENTNNDSSSITNNDVNHQSSATTNEIQSKTDCTNKASNNTNENGDVLDEEDEDLEEESE